MSLGIAEFLRIESWSNSLFVAVKAEYTGLASEYTSVGGELHCALLCVPEVRCPGANQKRQSRFCRADAGRGEYSSLQDAVVMGRTKTKSTKRPAAGTPALREKRNE